MIIDWFYSDDDFSSPRLYERTRDKEGTLQERIITSDDEDYIKPFCWIPKDTSPTMLARLTGRYPSVEI